MKKAITILLTLFLFSFQVNQTDPVISVKLKASEWQEIISIINDAELPGKVRRKYIDPIIAQGNEQMAKLKDTTKKKN